MRFFVAPQNDNLEPGISPTLNLSIMNLLRRFWIFVFVSFLFMRLTLAEYWGAENRFWLQWQRADVIGIVAVMVIAAAIMSVGYWILGLFGRIGKTVRDIGLLGFTLFYAKIAIVEIVFRENNAPIALSWLLNLVVLAAVVVSSFRLGKAVKLLDSACLILSPIVPIYVVSLLLAPPIPLFLPETPTLDKSSVEVRAEESRYPAKVFFFVFDALSYHRTFGDPARLIELPNLQKLANMSFVFSDAYSTANSTTAAVPGMLCGTNGAWSLMGSVPGLKTADGQVPVRDMRSLFQDMNERGYHTGVFGNALPYAVFFRNGVDVLTRRIMERPDMWERAFSIGKDVLSKHVAARAGRFLPEIEQTVKAGQITSCLAELNWLHEEALRRLQTQGQIFCYFHYLIPHYPLMYDSYGPVAPEKIVWDATWNEEAYRGNLRFVDVKLGELLDAVNNSRERDATMIVITADHSNRSDPLLLPPDSVDDKAFYEYCHVPLLIHLPGQSERTDIKSPFPMSKLKGLILEYLDSNLSEQEFCSRCNRFTRADIYCAIDRSKLFAEVARNQGDGKK